MAIYLLGTVFTEGRDVYASFEADTYADAKRRLFLRMSVANVIQVTLWKKDGLDWSWRHTEHLGELQEVDEELKKMWEKV